MTRFFASSFLRQCRIKPVFSRRPMRVFRCEGKAKRAVGRHSPSVVCSLSVPAARYEASMNETYLGVRELRHWGVSGRNSPPAGVSFHSRRLRLTSCLLDANSWTSRHRNQPDQRAGQRRRSQLQGAVSQEAFPQEPQAHGKFLGDADQDVGGLRGTYLVACAAFRSTIFLCLPTGSSCGAPAPSRRRLKYRRTRGLGTVCPALLTSHRHMACSECPACLPACLFTPVPSTSRI